MDSSHYSVSPPYTSKKRLWKSEEDNTLIECVREYGAGNWNKLARISGLERGGSSCRLRWVNHLNPEVNKQNFTEEEDNFIIKARNFYGNQWSKIVPNLPGRTDNQVKNRWNSYLSKKESLPEEDGITNHSEFHQNISHELFPNHEFHPDFFNEFFHQNLSPKPFRKNEFNQVIFHEPFAEQESYQYLPHEGFLDEPFLENGFHLWNFPSELGEKFIPQF